MLDITTIAMTYGPHMHAHDGGEWWWIGRIIFFLFWFTVIVLVFRFFSKRSHHSDRNLATTILAERYARGEIDADEYRKRREDLNS